MGCHKVGAATSAELALGETLLRELGRASADVPARPSTYRILAPAVWAST